MAANGFYFDHIYRQMPLGDDHEYNARIDYSDQYSLYSDRELRYYEKCADKAYKKHR